MSVTVKQDEYGNPLCPLQQVVSDWDDAGEHKRHWLTPCEGELYLEQGGTYALTVGMKAEDADWEHALATGWELKCANGHVLLASEGGEEQPTPFDPAWLESL